jgi:hypothetical protein
MVFLSQLAWPGLPLARFLRIDGTPLGIPRSKAQEITYVILVSQSVILNRFGNAWESK